MTRNEAKRLIEKRFVEYIDEIEQIQEQERLDVPPGIDAIKEVVQTGLVHFKSETLGQCTKMLMGLYETAVELGDNNEGFFEIPTKSFAHLLSVLIGKIGVFELLCHELVLWFHAREAKHKRTIVETFLALSMQVDYPNMEFSNPAWKIIADSHKQYIAGHENSDDSLPDEQIRLNSKVAQLHYRVFKEHNKKKRERAKQKAKFKLVANNH